MLSLEVIISIHYNVCQGIKMALFFLKLPFAELAHFFAECSKLSLVSALYTHIMLNALTHLKCSKLCRPNMLEPTPGLS